MPDLFNIGYSVLLELIPEFAIEHFKKNPSKADQNKVNQQLKQILQEVI